MHIAAYQIKIEIEFNARWRVCIMELLVTGFIWVLLKIVVSEKSVLHIGGFIEVNTTDKGWNSAGIRPAIDLAVKQINNRSDLLPNHTIQIHWKDTKVTLHEKISARCCL